MMNPDIDPLTGQPRVQGPSRQMYVQPTSIQGGYADQIAGQNLPLNNPVPGMYQEKKARRVEGKLVKAPIKEYRAAQAINNATGDTSSFLIDNEGGQHIISNKKYEDIMGKYTKGSTPQSAYETPSSVSGDGGSNLAAGVVKSQINPGNEVVEELKDAIPGVYKKFS